MGLNDPEQCHLGPSPIHPSVCALANSYCCYQPQALARRLKAWDSTQGFEGQASKCICAKSAGC